jgi:hypothetical protein
MVQSIMEKSASLALTVIIISILAYSKLLNTCSYECKIIEDISEESFQRDMFKKATR